MKYMKLGSKPDTFYTEQAVRSVVSDIPADLIIHVNNTKYQLHKFPLLLKCGLLQRLCSDTEADEQLPVPVALHDIPGGEEAFEICAKFCYGIAISISASNFVPAALAARFLRMTEHVAKGNLVSKLDTFFESCVLHGWRDSIAALQAAWRISGWSESRIVQPCVDSIVEKILLPPSQVAWSYTYTRPGYAKRPHQSVPKDWWTEDISELDIEVFRSVVSTVRATRMLPSPLIGEALHVYACKHLPDPLYTGGSANGHASQSQAEARAGDRRHHDPRRRGLGHGTVPPPVAACGELRRRVLVDARAAHPAGRVPARRGQGGGPAHPAAVGPAGVRRRRGGGRAGVLLGAVPAAGRSRRAPEDERRHGEGGQNLRRIP
uniref:BTB domain-containing protein n=1 Tax=Aegilops tauschii subsp. strangulata TaxID=200361 RepID=A0A453KIQ8_AEGTS